MSKKIIQKIYVTITSCGYGDDHCSNVVYAGMDRFKAIDAIFKHNFESDYNRYGTVEHWENDLKTKEEEVEIP